MARRSLAVLVVLALPFLAAAAPFRGGALDPPRPAPDFALQRPDGSQFRLSGHHGKVVVMNFGYTFCPDVCPTTLAEFAQIRARLGSAEKDVRFVFITVDPERDNPQRMRAYTEAFDRTFIGLTGSAEQLEAVRKAYGVTAHKRVVAGTSAAYLVDHSALIYVVDREGRLRLLFPFGTAVEDMTHDIKLLTGR
ncbi:MAG: SCO family protein [Candidatus Rokuibacteriota bacterium]